MSDLAQAMWRQARRDLDHAWSDLGSGYFEWSAYSAQQAAEKALKAVLLAAGRDPPRIHGLNRLLDALIAAELATPAEKAELQRALTRLDQAWVVSRCPLADINVAPADLVDEEQARSAIAAAEAVVAFAAARGVEGGA